MSSTGAADSGSAGSSSQANHSSPAPRDEAEASPLPNDDSQVGGGDSLSSSAHNADDGESSPDGANSDADGNDSSDVDDTLQPGAGGRGRLLTAAAVLESTPDDTTNVVRRSSSSSLTSTGQAGKRPKNRLVRRRKGWGFQSLRLNKRTDVPPEWDGVRRGSTAVNHSGGAGAAGGPGRAAPTKLSGYLFKKGRKRWKKAFFVLRNGALSMYKTERDLVDGKRDACWIFNNSDAWPAEPERKHAYVFVVNTGSRRLHLSAPSANIRSDWVSELKTASKPFPGVNLREEAAFAGIRLRVKGFMTRVEDDKTWETLVNPQGEWRVELSSTPLELSFGYDPKMRSWYEQYDDDAEVGVTDADTDSGAVESRDGDSNVEGSTSQEGESSDVDTGSDAADGASLPEDARPADGDASGDASSISKEDASNGVAPTHTRSSPVLRQMEDAEPPKPGNPLHRELAHPARGASSPSSGFPGIRTRDETSTGVLHIPVDPKDAAVVQKYRTPSKLLSTWMGFDTEDKPFAVHIAHLMPCREHKKGLTSVLYRTPLRDTPLDFPLCHKKSDKEILKMVDESLGDADCALYKVSGKDDVAELRQLDEAQVPDDTTTFKFGVMYYRGAQTEEEMFELDEESPAFVEFMESMGERVDMSTYDGYLGGLDAKSLVSGTHSYVSKLHELDIMYHVMTMMPLQPDKAQTHVTRKRHIGNDYSVIVFKEGGAPFRPDLIKTKYCHAFIVVEVDEEATQLHGGHTHYRVACAMREKMPTFGPKFKVPPVYAKGESLRATLLQKCVNGERASKVAEDFLRRQEHMREWHMRNIVERLAKANRKGK